MNNTKEKYLKAYYDLIDRTWKPFKDSMTEEEFERFRCEHTTDEFLTNYKYTFEEEIGYWLEIGDSAYSVYSKYMDEFGQKLYKVEVANELKRICG